ncbi:hypothetical protein BDY21DRAFT_366878 [Lineolata rhizophorae]|uniref:MYND-type zinc finger protein samB n=1 Tax=Lineolata rhizophorae TaxID=578093 RepID=A0A6A6NPI8_9PEZI|nr:hypothetical protein BDY21DRAFT_366878 [Lineolata rhizophorae]
MREVNFSIPNANKASVGITTALYDRRALDCTSTLPLINSLSHLAYLTTSSARIRDILTVDGGVERLVCILKEGRSKDMMEMWKWNLAFQCVVNIGVRGSESVRTRVVEADMVPVIATILDNYIKVIDKVREKADAELKRNSARLSSSRHHYSRTSEHLMPTSTHRPERASRRHAPPPIEIPQPFNHNNATEAETGQPRPVFSLSSPPERTTFNQGHHHHHHRHHNTNHRHGIEGQDSFVIQPVRDSDRLPSMLPALQGEVISQPVSPTTPSAMPNQARSGSPRASTAGQRRRRPSIRHQLSTSGDSDDNQNDEMMAEAEESGRPETTSEPIVGIQNDIHMQDIDGDEMLDAGTTPVGLNEPGVQGDTETFNITHRSALDGSIINPAANQAAGTIGFSPVQTAINVNNTPPPLPTNWYPRYGPERTTTPVGVLAAMPRDEDVLMSLQLLAYVSKYCNLRSYFQKSHLVPKLKIGAELQLLDASATGTSPEAVAAAVAEAKKKEEEEEEYLLPDDFNIFPLVEKFTVRHHSQEMQYWAGVVMRNLCRKDDARGGIRQCAYWQCGKWEEYTRQFAKCRRCRRTKYCSKECQKSAWVYHRHWCIAAESGGGAGGR